MSISTVTQADTGLGTTFERWALNRVLTRLQAQAEIRTAFEGPGDGMTGIAGLNSLALGLRRVPVTLLLPDSERAELARAVWAHHAPGASLRIETEWDGGRLPFEDSAFDLAWNFNVMAQFADPHQLLAELCRVSRRYVFICVPNQANYSFWLHRLHHQVTGLPWEHGDVGLMQPRPWQQRLTGLGWHTREVIWLDCPWWPDIVDVGQLVADFFPFLKRAAQRAKPENRYRWTAEALPYYRPDAYPGVHRHMERLAYFENSRWVWQKRMFAHHVGIVAEKRDV